jgi:hypothetical protein
VPTAAVVRWRPDRPIHRSYAENVAVAGNSHRGANTFVAACRACRSTGTSAAPGSFLGRSAARAPRGRICERQEPRCAIFENKAAVRFSRSAWQIASEASAARGRLIGLSGVGAPLLVQAAVRVALAGKFHVHAVELGRFAAGDFRRTVVGPPAESGRVLPSNLDNNTQRLSVRPPVCQPYTIWPLVFRHGRACVDVGGARST